MNDSIDDASNQWTKFGRYALLDKIGSGGMAEIYRAKTFGAAGFEKEYAIKLITPDLVDDTEFVEMFINEAKIVVNLYHANIVQVFDLGEIDDQYYIAMEYVHGKDLLDILARCAKLNIKIPLNLVLFITMEMLKGLNFAHRAKDPYGEDLNIIHRDVSPSNILISYAGDVKVGDFGVAKAKIQHSLDEGDTLKGKVGYMSPEQVMGEEIDSRSDIFSAGIVFFEALSMSRLFTGDSDLDVMLKVRDVDIEDDFGQVGALPSDLERIVRRALAKHCEDRFQTAEAFYQALVDFCYKHSIKVTGNDLSNLMRRLFAKEIEEEKSRRRFDPETSPPEAQSPNLPGSEDEKSTATDDESDRSNRKTPKVQQSVARQEMPSTTDYAEPEANSETPPEPEEPLSQESLGGREVSTDASSDDREAPTETPIEKQAGMTHPPESDGTDEAPPEPASPSAEASTLATDTEAEDEETGSHMPDPPEDAPGPQADSNTVPADLERVDYRVRDGAGDVYGPMTYDETIDFLQSHGLDREDVEVSLDAGSWRPIAQIPELEGVLTVPEEREEDTKRHTAGAQVFQRASTPSDGEEKPSTPEGSDEPSTWDSDPRNSLAEDTRADQDLEATVRAMEEINFAASRDEPAESSSDELDSGSKEPTDASVPEGAGLDEQTDADEEANVTRRSADISSSEMDSGSLQGLSTNPEEIESIHQFKNRYASYEGELEHAPFPRLFGRLYFARSTGRFHVRQEDVEKSVYFRDGKPILVESNKEEELLGSFLLSRDLITEEELDRALARLDEWGGRLGDALVAIGALPAHDIYELLSEQMREKLLDIFTWREGYYGYYENQEPDTKGYPLGVDGLELIVEGCKHYVPFGYLVDFYDDRMHVELRQAIHPPIEPDRLKLNTRELRVYNEISDGTTLSTLLDLLPSSRKSQVYRTVYLLHQLQMVTFTDGERNILPGLEDSSQ